MDHQPRYPSKFQGCVACKITVQMTSAIAACSLVQSDSSIGCCTVVRHTKQCCLVRLTVCAAQEETKVRGRSLHSTNRLLQRLILQDDQCCLMQPYIQAAHLRQHHAVGFSLTVQDHQTCTTVFSKLHITRFKLCVCPYRAPTSLL